MTSCLTALCCCCSSAGHGISWLLAGSAGTLLFLPLLRPVTGIWATWRSMQLAQIICSGSNPRLGSGTLHMAWDKTWVPPQAQDTPYHLVTQAVARSKQAHIKAQVDILCKKKEKKTAHICKATVWRWHAGAAVFKICAKWMLANCGQVCLLLCGTCAPATDYVCNESWLVGTKPLSTGETAVTLPCGFTVLPLNKTLHCHLEEATNPCRTHNKLLAQPVLRKFCLFIRIMTLKILKLPQNRPVQAPVSAIVVLFSWLVWVKQSLRLLKHHTQARIYAQAPGARAEY